MRSRRLYEQIKMEMGFDGLPPNGLRISRRPCEESINKSEKLSSKNQRS